MNITSSNPFEVLAEIVATQPRRPAMAKVKYKAARAYEAIAKSLREFGYPDASAKMIEDTHKAMLAEEVRPHGAVGMLADFLLSLRYGVGRGTTAEKEGGDV